MLSDTGGESWDMEHEFVLRDDAGHSSNAWADDKPGWASGAEARRLSGAGGAVSPRASFAADLSSAVFP